MKCYTHYPITLDPNCHILCKICLTAMDCITGDSCSVTVSGCGCGIFLLSYFVICKENLLIVILILLGIFRSSNEVICGDHGSVRVVDRNDFIYQAGTVLSLSFSRHLDDFDTVHSLFGTHASA